MQPGSGTIRGLATSLLVGLALFHAGCGNEAAGDEAAADALGGEKAGSVSSGVQCSDWVEGTDDEKLATIADLRGQLNRQDSAVSAPALSDEEAMETFEGACSEPYAASFKLYVLYARAAAFAPLTRDLPQ